MLRAFRARRTSTRSPVPCLLATKVILGTDDVPKP